MDSSKLIDTIESLEIQNDFLDFLTYFKENKVKLTNSGNVGPKDCFNINLKLYHSIETPHNKRQISKYPILLLFVNIGLDSRLLQKENVKSSTFLVVDEEKFEYFSTFNPIEKYFFLLEILWTQCDFDLLVGDDYGRHTSESVKEFFDIFRDLDEQKSDVLSLPSHSFGYSPIMYNLGHVIRDFSHLGWLEFKERTGKLEGSIPSIESIEISKLGQFFIEILNGERPFEYWNKYSRTNEDYAFETNFMFREEIQGVDKADIKKQLKRVESEQFMIPFLPHISTHYQKSMRDILTDSPSESFTNYVFKVKLTNKIWRKIAIAPSATFEELHLAVQEAFGFANDHLYAFFPSGKVYKGNSINDDRGGGHPPFACETTLEYLPVRKGDKIAYLFDFGDNWQFLLQVEEDNYLEEPLKNYRIIESKGEAPEQYPDW